MSSRVHGSLRPLLMNMINFLYTERVKMSSRVRGSLRPLLLAPLTRQIACSPTRALLTRWKMFQLLHGHSLNFTRLLYINRNMGISDQEISYWTCVEVACKLVSTLTVCRESSKNWNPSQRNMLKFHWLVTVRWPAHVRDFQFLATFSEVGSGRMFKKVSILDVFHVPSRELLVHHFATHAVIAIRTFRPILLSFFCSWRTLLPVRAGLPLLQAIHRAEVAN